MPSSKPLAHPIEPLNSIPFLDQNTLKNLVVKLKNSDATALDDAMILTQSSDETLLKAFEQIKAFEFEHAIALIESLLPKIPSKKVD